MIATILLLAAEAMTFTADRIAADGQTQAAVATGHIVAVSAPFTLRSESLSRSADGIFRFRDPTYATTCTNELGHTHWNVTGDIEYKTEDYVILRNMWLRFYEVPVLWLPYLYYPLDSDCGLSWMPGYTGRWGGYLLTRYAYDIAGGPTNVVDGLWLKGATRFDLRYRQGLAVGEDLDWSLGDYGQGKFNVYYAWDQSDFVKDYGMTSAGSDLDENRYGISFRHRVDPTERDSVRVRGAYYSDCYFRQDFLRRSMFNNKSQFMAYENSGVFWEHLENAFSFGAEASGRLNKFYDMTGRLPEVYFDVNPQPLFGLPVNFESENRVGYLRRDYADYGQTGLWNPYFYNRNRWAEYESARLDTYNRLTAPFTVADELVSIVPRIGYHGTAWNRSGTTNLDGQGMTDNAGDLYRTIVEGGVTFSARGTGWIDQRWRHMMEPYFDVLTQKAWIQGAGDRPYVFDSIDASVIWEDQFAGRSRNLPYSYYGVTPGFRNVWEAANESGRLVRVLDLDVYAAMQFNDAAYRGYGDAHRLSEVGYPNYGENGCLVVPGGRVRWNPAEDVTVMARAEYSADDLEFPVADVGLKHRVTDRFSYYTRYALRDYRLWDFSSVPLNPSVLDEDRNYASFHTVELGFERQPLEWFAWGPYVRWDIRDNEVDSVGTWFDLLTDCLGFRFSVEYENSMTWYGGYKRDEDWSFGFYIYLRAFGPGGAGLLQ